MMERVDFSVKLGSRCRPAADPFLANQRLAQAWIRVACTTWKRRCRKMGSVQVCVILRRYNLLPPFLENSFSALDVFLPRERTPLSFPNLFTAMRWLSSTRSSSPLNHSCSTLEIFETRKISEGAGLHPNVGLDPDRRTLPRGRSTASRKLL